MVLVLLLVLYYHISMKKSIFTLFLCFFSAGGSLFAAPFALDEGSHYNQLSQRIINKQKIRYHLNDSSMQPQVEEAFTTWFTNALDRLQQYPEQAEQATPLMPYLQHGATPDTYQRVTNIENADFYIHYTSDLNKYCKRFLVGCLKEGNQLYLIYPGTFNENNYVLKHEIGHAFGLEDLYEGQYPANGPTYGSGPRKGIMNNDKNLSCDDADGIINSIYLSLKKQNPQTEDFTFTSLCYKGGTFHNTYLPNRPPQYVDFKGTRTYYTYCTDGTPHSIVQIQPFDPENLISVLQQPKDCTYTKKDGVLAQADAFITATLMALPITKVPDMKKGFGFTAQKIEIPAEENKISLIVSLDASIPGYVYLTDEKQRPIYLFAYLENGYNLAYNIYLDGRYLGSEFLGDLFVYKRESPSFYYVQGGKCNASKEECQKMKEILEKNFQYFSQKYPLKKSLPNWSVMSAKDNITTAQKWEKLLLENFPPAFVVREKIESKFKLIPIFHPPLKRPS